MAFLYRLFRRHTRCQHPPLRLSVEITNPARRSEEPWLVDSRGRCFVRVRG